MRGPKIKRIMDQEVPDYIRDYNLWDDTESLKNKTKIRHT